MRPFTPFETENFKFIANLGISYTTFQTYWTSLDKGYFDAIAPMRVYFQEEGIHDYALQGQGHSANRWTLTFRVKYRVVALL